ncbi:Sodium channel protein 60E [Trichoplax sp. H2]|nr:Sodium channel protein 60E [Trichoplax sp. H2]|eukprot:RDD37663.1 Sodium channel protein 60E [Trichoplax sp. H2]
MTLILVILANCIFVAFPTQKSDINALSDMEYVSIGFNVFYTIEMLLKIVARGFISHQFAYLRDPWNWLDFFIVIMGYLTLLPNAIPSISSVRVLRAIRMITAIKGLKTIVNAVIHSMNMLANVLSLTLLFLTGFALLGVQLFMGVLSRKCIKQRFDFNATYNSSKAFNDYITNSKNWVTSGTESSIICGNDSFTRQCDHIQKGSVCYQDAFPNPGNLTNYDTFPTSLLVCFQITSQDAWDEDYRSIISALGPYYIPFFIFILFFGTYYVLNLVLAVIALAYNKEVRLMEDQASIISLMTQKLDLIYYSENYYLYTMKILKDHKPMKYNASKFNRLRASRGQSSFTFYPDTVPKRWHARTVHVNVLELLPRGFSAARRRIDLNLRHNYDEELAPPDACARNEDLGQTDNGLSPISLHNAATKNQHNNIGFTDEEGCITEHNDGPLQGDRANCHDLDQGKVKNGIDTLNSRRDEEETNEINRMENHDLLPVNIDVVVCEKYIEEEDSKAKEMKMTDEDASKNLYPKSAKLNKIKEGEINTVQISPDSGNNNENRNHFNVVLKELQEYHTNRTQGRQDKLGSTELSSSLKKAATKIDQNHDVEDAGKGLDGAVARRDLRISVRVAKTSTIKSKHVEVLLPPPSVESGEVKSLDGHNTKDKSEDDQNLSCFGRFRKRLRSIFLSPLYEPAMEIFVIIDSTVMALYIPLDDKSQWRIITIYVLSGIFVMETVLKLIAHRPRQFIKSKWDIFDTLITLPTLAQAILLITGVKETEWIIAALVTLRVTRIFRLARTWPAMRYLLRTLIFNMSALIYVNLMMVIFIYIFAVLGQKMFRDAYRKKFTEMPRFNFDNFESSCMMIFRIMCGEWIQPLGVAVKATSSWAIVFFLMVFLIGNLLVLNLFVALILSTLEDQSFQEKYNTENDSHLDQNFMHQLKSIFTSSCCFKKESVDARPLDLESNQNHCLVTVFNDSESMTDSDVQTETQLVELSDHSRNGDNIGRRNKLLKSDGREIDDEIQVQVSVEQNLVDNSIKVSTDQASNQGYKVEHNNSNSKSFQTNATMAKINNEGSYRDELERFSILSESETSYANRMTLSSADLDESPQIDVAKGYDRIEHHLHQSEQESTLISMIPYNESTITPKKSIINDTKESETFHKQDNGNPNNEKATNPISNNLNTAGEFPLTNRCNNSEIDIGDPLSSTFHATTHDNPLKLLDEQSSVINQHQHCNRAGNNNRSESHLPPSILKQFDADISERNTNLPEDNAAASNHQSSNDRNCSVIHTNGINNFTARDGNSYTSSDDIFGKKGDISVSHCLPDCIGEKFSKCIKVDSSSYQAWIAARKMIQKWMTHWVYNLLMILLIMASSILLAMEDKRAVQNPPYWYNIRLAESIVTLIFIVTIIFEIFARGISQYFSNGWNVLDFTVIVITLTVNLLPRNIYLIARTTKAIGPLRVIRRVQSIKMMFLAILESIPKIMNVFLVCMVFWYIFAVSGIYFFGGKFFRCIYVSNSSLVDSALVGDKDSCKGNDYKWTNSLIHFDDFPQAIILLFHVATFDGWKRALYNAVDARGINLQPVTYYNPAAHGYFVAFIIIGVFVALNLIVGVIIDGFYVSHQKLERQQSGSALEAYLTDSQRRWYRMMRKLLKTKPKKSIPRGNHQWQIRLRKFVENPKFEMTVIYIIVANVIVMMVTHYHESNEVHETALFFNGYLLGFNYFFTIFYVIEAVLKIIAFRLYYFKDAWNLFDFAVVILSISGLVFEILTRANIISTTANTTINPSTIRILRIFRIVRILRLVQYAQGIRRLLISLAMSAPALFNIGMLTFLVIFIYAVLGMSVFFNVKHTGVLTNVFNFDDFLNSLIVLFQLMTAAGWTDVSSALSIESPNCNSNDTTISPFGNCGNRPLSLLFTSSYVYLTWLVLSNLFVAVILSNYQDVVDTEAGGVTEMDIDIFYEVWAKYDTEATQFIDYSSLSPLVADIKPPLGVPQPNRYACIALDLPLYRSNRLHCLDIIEALLFRIIGNPADSDEELTAEFDILIRRIKKSFLKKFPSRVPANQINRISELEKANITAAIVIQRAYRKWRFKKIVNDRVERHQLVYRNVANRCEKKPQKGILKKIRNARNVNNA